MYTLRMRRTKTATIATFVLMTATILPATPSFAWGRYGHQLINELADNALPADVPAFLRDGGARDSFIYYAPEPDRWGSPLEPELKTAQEPDHFLSMEWSDMLPSMPRDRYDYVRALAILQAAHPAMTLKAEDVGTQPYQTNELWQRLRSSMREYRQLIATNQDTKPVEAEIVFLAGWMGHYVGDAAQPLHTSYRYNGWLGDNPAGYTTERHIHSQFESTFVQANIRIIDVAPLIPAKASVIDNVFDDYLVYLRQSHSMYEQIYKFEKAGALNGTGTPESRQFAAQCLGRGASKLRDLIYTAWVRSGDPLPHRQYQNAPPAPTSDTKSK
jgi:hypothetical protein